MVRRASQLELQVVDGELLPAWEAEGELGLWRTRVQSNDEGASLLVQESDRAEVGPYLYVSLGHYPGSRSRPWVVDCQLEQGDEHCSQFCPVSSHVTREEAAEQAADFVNVMLPLLIASCASGERQETPGDRREKVAYERLVDDSTYLELEQLAHQAGEEAALEGGSEAWRDSLRRRHQEARQQVVDYERRFVQAYHRSHDWRGYLGEG